MPPRHGRFRRQSKNQSRGRFLWSLADSTISTIDQNNKIRVNLLPSTSLDDNLRQGAVVTRCIGTWAVRADNDDVNGQMMLAMYTQRDESFIAGVDPELELDEWAYMWRDQLNIRVGNSSTPSDATNQWVQRPIDIKTKRKFRSQDDILVMLSENTSTDAARLERVFSLRVLLWIP